MKKKTVLIFIGIIVVLAMISGRSRTDKNEDKEAQEIVHKSTTRTKQEATTAVKPEEASTVIENSEEDDTAESPAMEEEVTPEFKEAMDSYEEFFDEYVKFMKEYSESDDAAGMLMDYSDYMIKYADMMDKIDKIDTEELSPADYAYYIEVTARIQKKLLEI